MERTMGHLLVPERRLGMVAGPWRQSRMGMVRVLPIRSGAGSDPMPGTLSCCIQQATRHTGIHADRRRIEAMPTGGVRVKQFGHSGA